MASKLIDYAKVLARDPKALSNLTLDRTTASYKLKYGVAETMKDTLLDELRTCPFSLNMDEASSKANSKVLAVLSSHFSPSQQKIVVHHLAAFGVVKVTSEALFKEISQLMERFSLPWDNLISVLMDSCRVMRGTKSGLETRIREKAKHLLDIDGDTCHHASNAASKFCTEFDRHVEGLLSDIHTVFKWSVDQRENFFMICDVLGIKPTRPERYAPHRWLSVLDVSADTSRLLDALTVFFASFLMVKDVDVYEEIVEEVLEKRKVSEKGRGSVKEIQRCLRKKWSSYTKEGKDRKLRVVDKLFTRRIKTLSILYLYTAVLPILKKYVLFFQKREPVVHRLHDKQEELLLEFLSCFMKPEALTKNITSVSVTDESLHLPSRLMFWGAEARNAYTRLDKHQRGAFKEQVIKAFMGCAKYLQMKMPVNNTALKICSVLDPATRNTTAALDLLYLIPVKTNLVKKDELDDFKKEARLYNSDKLLNKADTDSSIPIDQWWASVDQGKYPLMTRAAKGLLSCFHGPLVEGSFSIMPFNGGSALRTQRKH